MLKSASEKRTLPPKPAAYSTLRPGTEAAAGVIVINAPEAEYVFPPTVTLTLSGSCTAEPVTPPALVSSSRLDEEEPAFSAVVTGLSASSPRNAATPSRYACHVMTAPPPRYSLHSPSVSLRL